MPWPGSAELLAPLASWFERVRRDLPWRALNLDSVHPDPYAVLVSELMLQQTQVTTVIPFFHRWMARFPSPDLLAAADPNEIHKLWEGLGYYRRARHLQAAAREITRHGWPKDLGGFLELPGLGPYTAAAVASIAFQLPEPALDGNAFRVLARVLGIETDPKKDASNLRNWLKEALRVHGPARLTQALMEQGALVCGPTPKCASCPLATVCEAKRRGATGQIPARAIRTKPREFELWLVAVQTGNRWLLTPPASKGLLAGMWSWPHLAEPAPREVAAEYPVPFGLLHWRSWPAWTQVYSHRREIVHPLSVEVETPFHRTGMVWVEESDLQELPMGRRDQRLREMLQTVPRQEHEAPPIAGLVNALLGSAGERLEP